MAKKALMISDAKEGRGLNERQKLFCQYYIQSFNATQAYLKAYGCTAATAGTNGRLLLQKTAVRKEVARLKKELEEKLPVNENDMIRYCLKVVGADIGDYVHFAPQEVEVTADGVTTKAVVNAMTVVDSAFVDTSVIEEVKQQGAAVNIRLADKKWAWDKLDRFFGWTTRHNAEQNETPQIIITDDIR